MTRARDVLKRFFPLVLLLAAVGWLVFPYLGGTVIGGGDSVWYHHQAKDAVEQVRAGQFPIWVGQSHYAYNGAIHPHRSAPALLNTVAAADWLTREAFTSSQLLDWSIAGAVLLSALSCYSALRLLVGAPRTYAAVLAWIYVACPGVIGLAVAQDLYMSAFALPWIPWVIAGVYRASAGGTVKTSILLGAAAGLLFWCHAPIALWTGFGAGCLSLFLLVSATAEVRRFLKTLLLAIPVFFATAAYPIVSVVSLRVTGDRLVPELVGVESIMRELNGIFPAILKPVEASAVRLSVLQPGYSVLGLLVGGFLLGLISRDRIGRAGVAASLASCALLVFIFPIPWVTVAAWEALPEFWRSITNIWPNQRLVAPIACLAVASFAIAIRRQDNPRRAVEFIAILAAAWTSWEAASIRSLAVNASGGLARTEQLMRIENTNLSAYCFQQLPIRPANFIHGVTSPEMEFRWTERGSADRTSIKSWVEKTGNSPWNTTKFASTTGGLVFETPNTWRLEPGRLYLLTIQFDDPQVSGVLRLRGKRLDRAYLLPSAGGPEGFGAAVGQEKSIAVWTDGPDVETLSLSFEAKDTSSFALRSTWNVRLQEVVREKLPIQVERLVPLTLTLNSWRGGVIETPRMFIPGWVAVASDKVLPGARGLDGRLEIVVPEGVTQVTIAYHPTTAMLLTFWLGIFVFGSFVCVILFALVRPDPSVAMK